MPKINVLPREVAELIAAGEVIERPASIVKELIENSIDAGATEITIEIQHGGVRYLRVTDNGCGITREDAPTSFLRHATSKVKEAADLDKIGTLGFRGEALASIAAVSHVEMLTKTKNEEIGTQVMISGSELQSVEEAGCPDGTTIIVRDVFYNVPARLKFLKKDVTESNAVASIVDKIALSHPEISLSFIRDGKQSYRTPGNNDLLGTIYTVLGRDFARSMLPVDYTSGEVHVTGFICKPMSSRANRTMQHFFVNGRYTRTRTCGVALEEGYRGAMMVGKFPTCVLMIELPCEMVDVNVHPAKIEVRFVSEKIVFDAVYFSVKSTLSKDGKLSAEKEIQQAKEGLKKENALNPFSVPEPSEQVSIPVQKKEDAFLSMSSEQFRKEAEKTSGSNIGAKVQLREEWLPRKGHENMLDVEPDPADFEDIPRRVSEKDKKESALFHQLTGAMAERKIPQKPTGSENLPSQSEKKVSESAEMKKPIGRNLTFHSESSFHYEPEARTIAEIKEPPIQETRQPDLQAVRQNKPAADIQTEIPVEQSISKAEVSGKVSESLDVSKSYEVFGEIFSTYIICRIGEEFVLVDKHAAHERIRYNKLKSQGEILERQLLLTPVMVTLSREEHGFVLDHQDDLMKLGFEADDFGGSTIAVRSIPALMADASPKDLFLDTIDELSRSHAGVTVADEILHRMACRSAVKGGDHNTKAELEQIVKTIAEDENVRFCPHGRPVMVRYTRRELEKLFGRIQ